MLRSVGDIIGYAKVIRAQRDETVQCFFMKAFDCKTLSGYEAYLSKIIFNFE